MTDETLEQLSDRELLINLTKELTAIRKRLDGYDTQFEGIHQGLVHNSSAFDRLESVVYNVRSDVSALKADVKDLAEEVHQLRKENIITLEK